MKAVARWSSKRGIRAFARLGSPPERWAGSVKPVGAAGDIAMPPATPSVQSYRKSPVAMGSEAGNVSSSASSSSATSAVG